MYPLDLKPTAEDYNETILYYGNLCLNFLEITKNKNISELKEYLNIVSKNIYFENNNNAIVEKIDSIVGHNLKNSQKEDNNIENRCKLIFEKLGKIYAENNVIEANRKSLLNNQKAQASQFDSKIDNHSYQSTLGSYILVVNLLKNDEHKKAILSSRGLKSDEKSLQKFNTILDASVQSKYEQLSKDRQKCFDNITDYQTKLYSNKYVLNNSNNSNVF